jgi:hypothetical protein
VWSTQQLELLVDAVSTNRVWATAHGKVTEVWDEITTIVVAGWPHGIKHPDRKGVQAKYKELAQRGKAQQASASGRSGNHEEEDEPWMRTLLDSITAAEEHEALGRLSREERERKEEEVTQRHAQLREDAMRVLSEKKERKEKRGRESSGESSEEGTEKKTKTNIRGLLKEAIVQSAARHQQQMEAHSKTQQTLKEGVELINSTLAERNNLFAQFLQLQQRRA